MAAEHPLLRWLLPASVFAAVRAGTKQWLRECSCGHVTDLWDTGGVRYLASGEPRKLRRCGRCGRITWHKIRRKSPQERQQLT